MSIAVIISGHMRTFAACLPTLKWQVLRHYGTPEFFVSTVRDERAETWRELERHFPGCVVHVSIEDSQPDIDVPAPWRTCAWAPYAISVPQQAVLKQLWQLSRAWKLYKRMRLREHATVIRTRPDLWFSGFAPCVPANNHAFTPWWGRFGGINDRFAVLGQDAARAYFTTFDALPELAAEGAPLHPETLVCHNLKRAGCCVNDTLRAEFSTIRENGECRAPEISGIDIAHAALRLSLC